MSRSYQYLIKLLDLIHPKLAARLVYHLLSNPKIQKTRDREAVVLETARKWYIPFRDMHIQGYSWGLENTKPLFLIHGWEGHTGNFGALVEPLVQKRYRVYGFDAPAHGRSSKGRTDMFLFSEFLQEMFRRYHPSVIISHSFGTTSAALALRKLTDFRLDHWLMIASPHTFRSRIETVRKQYDIPPNTMLALNKVIENRSGESIDRLNFEHYREFLGSVRAFSIIHSRSDAVVPYRYAEDIHKALPSAKAVSLDGVGHFGILWSEDLLQQIDRSLADFGKKS